MELILAKDKEIEQLRYRLLQKTVQDKEKDEIILNTYGIMWHKDQVIAEKEAEYQQLRQLHQGSSSAPCDFDDQATAERKHKIEELKQQLHQASFQEGKKDPQPAMAHSCQPAQERDRTMAEKDKEIQQLQLHQRHATLKYEEYETAEEHRETGQT